MPGNISSIQTYVYLKKIKIGRNKKKCKKFSVKCLCLFEQCFFHLVITDSDLDKTRSNYFFYL